MHATISKLKFTLIKQYMLVKHEGEFENKILSVFIRSCLIQMQTC